MFKIQAVNQLGKIRGGCYCYCFEYPARAEYGWNATKFVSEEINEEQCRVMCDATSNQKLGYYGFAECQDDLPGAGAYILNALLNIPDLS